MSKNKLQRSGKHRRCGFANGARELYDFFLLFSIFEINKPVNGFQDVRKGLPGCLIDIPPQDFLFFHPFIPPVKISYRLCPRT